MKVPHIVLFTRWPEAGKAKTRMIPALGAEGAAALHRQLTDRTAATLCKSGLRAEIRFTGAEQERFENWLGDGFGYCDQGEGDLGARMARAAQDAPVILVGSDCPGLGACHLQQAAKALETAEIVIGPAEDGGYWLIALARPMDFLFADMEWGGARVFAVTRERLAARGIEPVLLETLADCDRPEDLARWPELAS
ncbi:TIGR04282 family arsenosugar biosynthesis glycosyltransferase [Parasphingopyxis marina]|uniref:TIGR04282 family arsenosugar biosynthesis glycosyltransferase n=1 Tax=Parasphingopyxis marina TaxID=2761622 RepID=A0A842I1J4_9SPHN|nr:TIGR04282 family arsenosugar biosynthesis glycosyltransferase [Parasphingopyxis marina]MBC2778767.1 TIGR04282 family arsenosugar biosynthesis glycosyltransferase [Parasphingopyxis marina]